MNREGWLIGDGGTQNVGDGGGGCLGDGGSKTVSDGDGGTTVCFPIKDD